MPTAELHEFDASDIDARVVGGVAVLALTTSEGRVAVSMLTEVLERLALRIQMELASDPRRASEQMTDGADSRPADILKAASR